MTHTTSTQAWQRLTQLAATDGTATINELLTDPSRLQRFSVSASGIYADLSKQRITDAVLSALINLAEETDVRSAAAAMAEGATVNTSEGRPAAHMAIRRDPPALNEAFDTEVDTSFERMAAISDAMRQGSWQGVTGEAITDVINIGIGGSDLGPKMVCTALREFADGPRCHFIANVDGAEINGLLRELQPATTAVIISSKTFTTQETLRNAETAMAWLKQGLDLDNPATTPHVIAVTASPDNAMQYGVPAHQIVLFPTSIGGRYSLWSAIGLAIAIQIGFDHFRALLAGAATMDQHFLTAPLAQNMPVLMALTGIWNHNFLGMDSQAVIPYCERLRLFVDHLQQMDMESNGKSATATGETVDTDTGPIIWGQTGTNGQHAFFQLLHQGTRATPVDFIGCIEDPLSHPEHHRLLLANMVAQSEALMLGRASDDAHRHYPGNRPSTTLLLDRLDPATLGALVALYEQKVFVQAAIWQINPFDQWGVELGKELATEILTGDAEHDPSTTALLEKTGLNS